MNRTITVRFPDRLETRTEKELDYLHQEVWNLRHPPDFQPVADEVGIFCPELVQKMAVALTLDWEKHTFRARTRPTPQHLRRAHCGDLELDSTPPETLRDGWTLTATPEPSWRVYNEADYELLLYVLRRGWQGNGYLHPATGIAIVTE